MRRLAAALALLSVLATPCLAGDEPIGDGRLARIRLGWEGFFPKDTVAPVTLLLTNPDPREHVLRVVVNPEEGESVETTVTLPPGARKRIRFALRATKGLSVSLSENGKLMAYSHHLTSPLPVHAVLVVDGEPETLVAKELVTGVIAFTTRPEDLPGEVACLTRFNAVILRMLDPSQLDPGARAGLDDFVRAGGTVLVTGTLDRAATRAFYEEQPGAEERLGSFAVKHQGLGRVVLEPSDLGAPNDEAGGAAALRRAALGQLLVETPRVVFPRLFVGGHPREAATEAGLALLAFLLAYVVVAGPVFMIVFRRARPFRVLQATVLLLLAFVGLGALTTRWILRGTASIKVFSFVVIPARGEPLVLSDVLVQSGGGRSVDLVLEGEDVSATFFGRLGRRSVRARWSHDRSWAVDASTTQRAPGRHEVSFVELPIPSFGETNISVLASARKWHPIVARVEIAENGEPRVAIENDSGHDLGATLVFERLRRNGTYSCARFPGVRRGAKVKLPLVKKGRLDPAMIGIPSRVELVGWTEAQAMGDDGRPSRFLLIAEDDPLLAVRALRATVEDHSWRVQGVEAAAVTTAGYLGLTVQASPLGARITIVEPGSPAESAGWTLAVGRVITSMAGLPVTSQDDVDRALRWAGPGAAITIVGSDGYGCELQLAEPPAQLPQDRGGY